VIDEQARSGLIRRIFENRVTDLLLRFMLVLNANERLGHFDSIQAAYDQMVQDAFGRIEVDVITAIKLDEATLARISERIQAALGKEPVLHPSIDESIIGGLQLRIGDRLMDGSVATRLRRLGDQLRKNGGHAIRTETERFMEDSA
jgi:F-type H+-transporting ATPase subunit delta